MQNQALATTSAQPSKPPESQSRNYLIRDWLLRFALNAGQALNPTDLGVFQALWEDGFADLSCDVLEVAFRRTLRECKFWPVKVADVRERVDKANSAALELEAAEAWERWFAHVQKYFHADLGWDRHAPHLDAITEHAGRAAGGAHWIECC